MSLVFISALSNFSVVSVGFNLPARQIASNPRTSLSELFAFCQIFFFFLGTQQFVDGREILRVLPCLFTGQIHTF